VIAKERAANRPDHIDVSWLDLSVAQIGATVAIKIADDGPGLPEPVRSNLFSRSQSSTGGSGYGCRLRANSLSATEVA
jgi:signal transduction histidine kinase